MDIYQQNSRWKTILALIAAFIILISLLYSNYLATKIETIERDKVSLYANTLKKINEASEDEDITYYFEIINGEQSIPVITIDHQGNIINFSNLNEDKAQDSIWLHKQKEKMLASYPPIEIDQPNGETQFYIYKGSALLEQLRWFPFVQFGIIALFLFSAYVLFNQARKSEQNQVWVGMSKETAHQLGTPISSLMAWVELLKSSDDTGVQEILPDMERDLNRLELISDRFSKIGSKPQLEIHNLNSILEQTMSYLQKRSSKHIHFSLILSDEDNFVLLYPALFNWVIENLIKNAQDAMEGDGSISVKLAQKNKKAILDISDTGKGISLRNKNVVFRPGYSTKKRGWGLGLSLSKRIIEEYHNGKIFVLSSIREIGTTFRIELDLVEE